MEIDREMERKRRKRRREEPVTRGGERRGRGTCKQRMVREEVKCMQGVAIEVILIGKPQNEREIMQLQGQLGYKETPHAHNRVVLAPLPCLCY